MLGAHHTFGPLPQSKLGNEQKPYLMLGSKSRVQMN